MKKGFAPVSAVAVACLAVVTVAIQAAEVHEAASATTCNPMELSVCLPAINGSGPPTVPCCAKLTEQAPCFCSYINNPVFRPYIGSPNAKKVAAACGVPTPTC